MVDEQKNTALCGVQQGLSRRNLLVAGTALVAGAVSLSAPGLAIAQQASSSGGGRKPNILMIMADDIGWFNASIYNHGMMGYRTPNIDRIGTEGAMFTDWYGEQSCTAGRAAFITGQSPIRTGLTKVGLPGADIGLRAEDPSVAEFLKPLGYATGQFGKNHLGDKDEFLPTNHGFDEFFGNLYHLNAEEEPENPDYPKNPNFSRRFGPRGVIKASADGRIEDTGPLTTKRMETVDQEFLGAAMDFIDRQQKADKPWFCYFNPTRMHVFTHLKPESKNKTGLGLYPDGMVELDGYVGQLLQKLEDLGVADDTIVVFTTDNGAEVMSWPDGGNTPFRGEKATNWEGGYRVPMLIRWPGTIKPGTVFNQTFAHYDLVPTFAAAGGDPDIVEKCLNGGRFGTKTFKVHLDGYNLIPFFKGEVKDVPRREFIYWNDDGQLVSLRYDDWKAVFMEQNHDGIGVWMRGFEELRIPKLFNLRADPFERGDESILYDKWLADHAFVQVPLQALAANWLSSFKEFPPRQKPASFNLDKVVEQLSSPASR
ncbi:arylsulfatase [Rhizobium ruizarguesonis]|uniref:arylsulfatase n=1 Tax=Rhizobium ruizarguesonis TaxID=2081791 RepID=UPI0010318B0E|nr:arylsulfatase [Rhizobium ruizarguesonis]TAV97722.1 arylsulfatase [Rhizobium ruizarguesonis]TAW88078.1 arylsulfatase [Rhizobium ruizarguesonis]